MKKYLLAVSVLGMIGAGISAFAEVDVSLLPEEVQSVVREAEKKAAATTTSVDTFVDDSTKSLDGYYQELNSILSKKGYLKQDQLTLYIQEHLKSIKDNIGSVKSVETPAADAQSWLGAMPALLEALNKLPNPGGFPAACADYSGKKVVGIVSKKTGSRDFVFKYHPYSQADEYPFLSEITDVGLHGSGAEYVVSLTPDGEVQDAWVGTDPKTKKDAIVCLSHAYKPSASELPKE